MSHCTRVEFAWAIMPPTCPRFLEIASGRCDEWHVDIVKSLRENDMGEKGLSCFDGFDYEPILGKEAQQCVFLTTDGFANK
jgi:hypothetical protein